MKNKIKRIAFALLVSFAICVTTVAVVVPPISIEAHGGRTDSNGGHKDNKNKSGLGSYHYHCGGNPAHLHPDGICPYANTPTSDKTSAGVTAKETSTVSSTNTKSNIESKNKSVTTEKSSSNKSKQTVKISDTSYDNVAFNASYYANNNEDLYKKYGDDAKALYEHFITCGIIEGRQSSEQFSILVYKDNNQDLVDVFGDDLIKYYDHFIKCGFKENRVSK